MIDRHYGHLARDAREHAIRLLDAYRGAEALNVHAVDAQWTLNDSSGAMSDNETGTRSALLVRGGRVLGRRGRVR
jgi:hypothetical protein